MLVRWRSYRHRRGYVKLRLIFRWLNTEKKWHWPSKRSGCRFTQLDMHANSMVTFLGHPDGGLAMVTLIWMLSQYKEHFGIDVEKTRINNCLLPWHAEVQNGKNQHIYPTLMPGTYENSETTGKKHLIQNRPSARNERQLASREPPRQIERTNIRRLGEYHQQLQHNTLYCPPRHGVRERHMASKHIV